MTVPFSQNGSGNQLVPLGSQLGAAEKRSAMTIRAKSSSESARNPVASTAAEVAALASATQSASEGFGRAASGNHLLGAGAAGGFSV